MHAVLGKYLRFAKLGDASTDGARTDENLSNLRAFVRLPVRAERFLGLAKVQHHFLDVRFKCVEVQKESGRWKIFPSDSPVDLSTRENLLYFQPTKSTITH